jgi:hypothetical protein
VLHVTVPSIPGAKVRSRRGGDSWQVTAKGVHAVQRLCAVSVDVAALTELEVKVEFWRPPVAGWVGSPRLAGVSEVQIVREDAGATVRLSTAAPTDAALLLAAAVRCLRPVPTRDSAAELTFSAGLGEAAACLAPDVRDVVRGDEKRDRHLRRADVLVVPAGGSDPEVERASTLVIDGHAWSRDGVDHDVSVDPTIHRPVGRRSTGANVIGKGTFDGVALSVRTTDATLVLDGSVSAANARALRDVAGIVVDGAVSDHLQRQLDACGVLVSARREGMPAPDDDLGWQSRSVAARRHALRQYGPSAALDSWPSVSVILATHRPDHLESAMRYVSGLRYPRLEVVVGAHGPGVDAARVWELTQDVPHPVTVVPVEADRTLGEVLQRCTDRAEGALITKMDDDDVYGPEHVWDLVLARQYSGAEVVGKALDWIYVESENATVFRPVYGAEKYANFVAGGTILIARADLMAVGGWRPVPKSVDRALLDRVLAAGGLVYRTHGLGYVYVRHLSGHTANVNDEHFLTKVRSRHAGLLSHEAFGTAT